MERRWHTTLSIRNVRGWPGLAASCNGASKRKEREVFDLCLEGTLKFVEIGTSPRLERRRPFVGPLGWPSRQITLDSALRTILLSKWREGLDNRLHQIRLLSSDPTLWTLLEEHCNAHCVRRISYERFCLKVQYGRLRRACCSCSRSGSQASSLFLP